MHHIRRQRWQIQTADRATAFAIRSGVRQHLDALTSTFERGFDAIDRSEVITHIPRLTLHLRVSSADDLLEKLPIALAEQLSEALLEQRYTTGSAVSNMAPGIRLHEILLLYLKTGNIAWPELSIDVATQIARLKDAAQAWLNIQRWSEFHQAAPNSFSAAIPFFQRLLPLLDTGQREQLHALAWQALPQMDDPGHVRLTLIQALFDLPIQHQAFTLNAHQRLYLQAMQLASVAGNYAPDIQGLIELLRREIGSTAAQTFIRHLAAARVKHISSASAATGLAAELDHELTLLGQAASATDAKPQTKLPGKPSSPTADELVKAALFKLPPENTERAPGQRVHAAGLILLHPYFSHLFNACEIALDEGRIAAHDLPRAAAILHWLACSREEIFEFELGAIKLLLGLRPEDPLPVSAGLIAAREKEECQALLTAVIGHWKALGATSAEGMQVSFLQRQGLLSDADGHWQLMLESEAFDVLLAQLPWSISLIKLPWMTKPIFTDWPTR